jgi:HPt (histidine-containing phosphotransfer) domain-containing protein
MDGFAPKPVDMAVLVRELARVLRLEPADTAPAAGDSGTDHVLNLVQGLQRWGGEEQPYYRALHMFVQERMDLGHRLAGIASNERYQDGAALTHQAKGVAANLGLEQLSAALDRLEHGWQQAGASADAAIDDPDARNALAALLAQASEQVAIACGAITTVLAAQKGAPSGAGGKAAAPALDAAQVRALAQQLHQSIDSGAFDDALMQSFGQALAGHVAPGRLDELRTAMNNFDFSAAHARLEALLAACLPPHAGSTP